MAELQQVDVEALAAMERSAHNFSRDARKFARVLFTQITGVEVPDILTFTSGGDKYGMWLDVRVQRIERGTSDGD